MTSPQSKVSNILLHTMAATDYRLLELGLERIDLPVRLRLHEAGKKIEHVYFPEDGIISIVAGKLGGKNCEVGLLGREGMSGTAIVMGTDHSPHQTFVQAGGISALKLRTAVLDEAMARSSTMRLHLLKYVQSMMIQLSSSIAAAGQTVEQRLARWLLMCHDRVDANSLSLTHEFIATMLGIRRASVTGAISNLSAHQIITTRPGTITIVDRAGLEAVSAGGYGLAEVEYERLVGVALRRDARDPQRPVICGRFAA